MRQLSWYRAPAQPDADPSEVPLPALPPAPPAGLAASLRSCVGRRVTLLWRCGPAVASTTGWIVKAEGGVVEVRGAMRTLAEAVGRVFRRGTSVIELNTVIPARSVCALIEDVPRGVQVAVPLYLPGLRQAQVAPREEAPAERRGMVVELAQRRRAVGA